MSENAIYIWCGVALGVALWVVAFEIGRWYEHRRVTFIIRDTAICGACTLWREHLNATRATPAIDRKPQNSAGDNGAGVRISQLWEQNPDGSINYEDYR